MSIKWELLGQISGRREVDRRVYGELRGSKNEGSVIKLVKYCLKKWGILLGCKEI
jgi:hypothetical protein